MQEVDVDLDPCEWIIVSATKQKYTTFYSCCSEPYFNVDFKLVMQRRSPAYHATLFTPAFGMSFLYSLNYICNICSIKLQIKYTRPKYRVSCNIECKIWIAHSCHSVRLVALQILFLLPVYVTINCNWALHERTVYCCGEIALHVWRILHGNS